MIGFGGPPASDTPDVELGNRANKVGILRKDNSIEIKPKGWLGKRDWREKNEVLLRNGFEWLSSGEGSCWIKMKTSNNQSNRE